MADPTPSPTPTPLPDPTPPHWYNNVPAQWFVNGGLIIAIVVLFLHWTSVPTPPPAPSPAPQDISLPAEVQAQPGRQQIVEATTKGAVVHWYIFGDGADVSYHPEVPKATVSAVAPGRYPLIAWTAVDGRPTPAASSTLVVGNAPPPGPTPPGPAPPTPIQVGKIRVLVVLDKNAVASLPKGQQDIIALPKDVRDYLNAHCGLGEDGKTPEYRFFDYQQDVSASSAAWKAGMQRALAKMTAGKPYMVVANETASWDGDMPADKAGFLAKLKEYGGP